MIGVKSRAIGGFLIHTRAYGGWTALCGFKPSARFEGYRQMKFRHGWTTPTPGSRECKKCAERLGSMQPKDFC